MIKSEHLSLTVWKLADGGLEDLVHFRAQRLMIWILLFSFCTMLQTFVFRAFARVCLQTADVKPAQIAQKPLQIFERHLKFDGDFRLRRVAPEFGLARQNRLFEAARLTPQRARAPIDLPETVEYCASYAKFGVVLELDVLARIVFLHRIDEANDPGVNQIFKQNLRRQSIVYAARDILHLRKMLEQDLFATSFVHLRSSLQRHINLGWIKHVSWMFIERPPWIALKQPAESPRARARQFAVRRVRASAVSGSGPACRRASREKPRHTGRPRRGVIHRESFAKSRSASRRCA